MLSCGLNNMSVLFVTVCVIREAQELLVDVDGEEHQVSLSGDHHHLNTNGRYHIGRFAKRWSHNVALPSPGICLNCHKCLL